MAFNLIMQFQLYNYRNPFLATAMVNLNMIDTVGSGIPGIVATWEKVFKTKPEYEQKYSPSRIKMVLDISEFVEKSSDKVAINDKSSDKVAINDKSSDKVAINNESGDKNGDKVAINAKKGDKTAIKFKELILNYLRNNKEARSQELSLYIGLKISRTKVYLSELVEEGKIVANIANKNRTYSQAEVIKK